MGPLAVIALALVAIGLALLAWSISGIVRILVGHDHGPKTGTARGDGDKRPRYFTWRKR